MLTINNETTRIRKQLGAAMLKAVRKEELYRLDHIPIDLRPRIHGEASRCCVYKDRAMLRYRLMALLGFSIEEDDNEYLALAEYAEQALTRQERPNPVLTVIDMACSACRGGTHTVSDMCMGCVARPCRHTCPVSAITMVDGHAKIDTTSCINCKKCTKVCPYSAISYTPVPCEEKCPVRAISKGKDGKARINYDKCIFCGRCTRSCPFGAVMERSSLVDVARLLWSSTPIVALVAPSLVGQFPGTMGQVVTALHQLGFSHVEEVAEGADKTITLEAEEYMILQKDGPTTMGTSCCPAYTEAVRKHVPEFTPHLSHTKSPLYYSAEMASQRYPGAPRVFIGPCVAKKAEAQRDSSVEFVLTYEELGSLFLAEGLQIEDLAETPFDSSNASAEAWGFATSGGVSTAVAQEVEKQTATTASTLCIDGLDKKGLAMLRAAGNGKFQGKLVEVMSCHGGCLGGPGIIAPPALSTKKLEQYVQTHTEESTQPSIT